MLHPIMPFVTEEAWQRFGGGESVMVAPWPQQHPAHRDQPAEDAFGFIVEAVTAVRRFRKSHGLSDARELEVRVEALPEHRAVLRAAEREVRRLAAISKLVLLDGDADPTGCATLVADGSRILIPLEGILDPDVERARLSKRMVEVEADLARSRSKLSNQGFLDKAPQDVVEKERRRLDELRSEAAAVVSQLDELG